MMYSKGADKTYTEICSEKTLQSNEKGFFMTFVDRAAYIAGDHWINSNFGNLNTDLERIKAVYEDETIKYIVRDILSNVQEVYRRKDVEIATSKRLEAQKAYYNGDLRRSLALFSQAVLRAPEKDSTHILTHSLLERASVLVDLNEHSFALSDLQAVVKSNLPNKYKAQAFHKMAVCHKAKGNHDKAEISFALAEKLTEDLEELERLRRDRQNEFKETKKSAKVAPNVTGQRHPQYPHASGKIEVKQAPGMGRYVVAGEKISTGDVIVVEEPFAACLVQDCFGTHCHHCFERLVSPVGCTTCSNIAFCSPECRDNALSTYHRFECRFLSLLMGSGMSILAHVALRMVTQQSLERQLKIFDGKHKEQVYSLCTNASMRKSGDFLQRTLMAAFLLRCLQESGYFKRNTNDVQPTEDEYKIGALILFSLQMLQFNAHEIYETRHNPEHRFRGAKAAYIGVGVFPTVALFNHDCYPAVTRYFVGKKIVINAVRPLNAGEIVAENYGPVFTRRTLSDRQKSLSARYWFDCKCTACVQDWPGLDNGLADVSRRIRCPTSRCTYLFTLPVPKETMKCPRCKKTVNLTDTILQMKNCEEKYQMAFEAMEKEEPRKAIALLCPAIETFHKVSCPPHKDTSLGQEILRACLADSGNVYCMTKS